MSKSKFKVVLEATKYHMFLGGNYGVGSKTWGSGKGAIGLLGFTRLEKSQKIGSKILDKNKTDESDTLVFMDVRTVDTFIKHLNKIKKDMTKCKRKP